MPPAAALGPPADHVGGDFEWEVAPDCCGRLLDAIDQEKFVFVSSLTSAAGHWLYILPLNSAGALARTGGVELAYCPWCGAKIRARKAPARYVP